MGTDLDAYLGSEVFGWLMIGLLPFFIMLGYCLLANQPKSVLIPLFAGFAIYLLPLLCMKVSGKSLSGILVDQGMNSDLAVKIVDGIGLSFQAVLVVLDRKISSV